eukprot:m.311539 g.311539  ORF g.311539 m.311539 type:complete len:419 (+) comp27873_c0_seq1:146-1402(+)
MQQSHRSRAPLHTGIHVVAFCLLITACCSARECSQKAYFGIDDTAETLLVCPPPDGTIEIGSLNSRLGSIDMLYSKLRTRLDGLKGRSLCAAGDLSITTLPAQSAGGSMRGAVVAPNGLLYTVPSYATSVAIIDPETNTVDTTSLMGDPSWTTTPYKWHGGVLAPNGKIYCIPDVYGSVLIIDPATNTMDYTSIGGYGTDFGKWHGGVLAPNGKIYCIPFQADSVLVIDPATNTGNTDFTLSLEGDRKWSEGVLAADGKIYCAPYNVNSVLIIDPATNTIDTSITIAPGLQQYTSVVLLPSGLIYMPPLNASAVLVLDPATREVDTTTITLPDGPDLRWHGSVLARDGRIYSLPYESDSMLIVDPSTNTTETIQLVANGTAAWNSVVLAPTTSQLYGLPNLSPEFLVVGRECASNQLD